MKVEDSLSKSLFWDTNPAQLDWHKHAVLIIERSFQRGITSDVRTILQHYSTPEIKRAILKSKGVFDAKTANFLSRKFNIPYNQIDVIPEHY